MGTWGHGDPVAAPQIRARRGAGGSHTSGCWGVLQLHPKAAHIGVLGFPHIGVLRDPAAAPQIWACRDAGGFHTSGCWGVLRLHPKAGHIGVPGCPTHRGAGESCGCTPKRGTLGCWGDPHIGMLGGPMRPGGVRPPQGSRGRGAGAWPDSWVPAPFHLGSPGSRGGGAPPARWVPAPPLRASVSPPAAPWKVGNFQCVGPGGQDAGEGGGRMPGGPLRPYNARPRRPRRCRHHAR